MTRRTAEPSTRRAARLWTGAALLVFNTGALFLLLNLTAWAVLGIHGATRHRVSPAYDALMASGFDTLRRVYPGREDGEIEGLLRESWTLPLEYEPYTQFRERPVAGHWVNVAGEGFRRNGPGRPTWPPPAGGAVFVFGGSTAFGYGLADDETLPARLARRLEGSAGVEPTPAVYNFGRAYYTTSQERVLFERLLADGHAPRVALFLDGLNDTLLWPEGGGVPYHSEALSERVEAAGLNVGEGRAAPAAGEGWAATLARLPAIELARRVLRRATGGERTRRAFDLEPATDGELARRADELAVRIGRERRLARAAAAAWGVEPLFVLQPVPWYRYEVSQHLFRPPDPEAVVRLERRFAAYYRALAALDGPGALDCSGALEDFEGPAFVDAHHYGGEAMERLADCVEGALVAALRETPPSGGDPPQGAGRVGLASAANRARPDGPADRPRP